jgi:large subunit ribosomal protein L31
MRKDIHPQYFANAKIVCACGNTITTGSTREETRIEICSACHPYYTGRDNLIDTQGRVEKFKARQTKGTPTKAPKAEKAAVAEVQAEA